MTCCYDYLFVYDLCKGKGQLQNLKFLPLWSGFTGVFLHVRCIPHHNSIRQVWASVWSQLLFSRLYQLTSVQFFSFKAGVQAAPPVLHQRRHWMSAGGKKQEEHGSRSNIFKYVIIIRPYAWPQGLYRTSDVLQSWLVFALQMAAIGRVREITGHMYTLSGFFSCKRLWNWTGIWVRLISCHKMDRIRCKKMDWQIETRSTVLLNWLAFHSLRGTKGNANWSAGQNHGKSAMTFSECHVGLVVVFATAAY